MFKRQFMPNLNVLRAFEVAGRHLSFKVAAEELHVTPSAVSQQIKNLENQLGVVLFIRKNRSLAFTSEGKRYWEKVHQSINDIYQSTSALVNTYQQELKVSLMPPVANRVIFPNLNSFHQKYTHINLRIDSSQKFKNVLKGEIDVAVRFGQPPWEGVANEKLCDVYIQVVCPPGFTEQYQLAKDPKNLLKVPLIQMSQSPTAWNRWFEEAGWGEPHGKQHILDNYPSAIQAAESLGAMLAIMPLESTLIKSGRLEAPFPPIGPIDESIFAVYKPGNPKEESIGLFIAWVKEEIEKLTR